MTYLYREHLAYARFLDEWGLGGGNDERDAAQKVADALSTLWNVEDGFHHSYNVTSGEDIDFATYALAVPLWGGTGLLSSDQAASIVARVMSSDMLSPYGVRSSSSANPEYNNDDIITPYSNWRGPVWVNACVMVAWGMLDWGFYDEAEEVARRVMGALAGDLRLLGVWHEDYDAEGGEGLSAEGFLSWNTLGYRLLDDVMVKRNNPMKV